ncbi:MAG: hypothetical protein HFG79_17065 [Lachnospiraceae bacterium]|jgi:hypothetical protein|nr:hypothetical protein [Lachnospiraceae bacterium]
MSKEELRKAKYGNSTAAGNAKMELEQIKKLQCAKSNNARSTITVGCGGLLTLVCCP